MKKTVEQKAELAKLKIDKKLQKQKQKFEKTAAKKEAAAAKKEERFELAEQKKAAKKELTEQKKAAKKEIADKKKQTKQQAAKEKAAAKREAEKQKQAAKQNKSSKNQKAVGGSKKKLLIGISALVFVGGGVSGFLFFKGDTQQPKDPYVEAYVLDDDTVESISHFLGESETRALPEITEVENGENKEIIYDYTELTDASEEVKDYVNYLTEEKGFVPMFDYNLNNPGGYVSIATASQEEGKIFKMDIDYTNKDYKVIVTKTDQQLPQPEPEQTQEVESSRESALNYLEAFPMEDLGLAKPVGEYMAIYDEGRSLINNSQCYGINLYELGPAGTNVAVGKFFVPTDMSRVYKYSPLEDSYFEIEDKTAEAEAAKAAAEQKAQQEKQQTSETTENIQENTTNMQQTDLDTTKQTDTTKEKTNVKEKKPAKEVKTVT